MRSVAQVERRSRLGLAIVVPALGLALAAPAVAADPYGHVEFANSGSEGAQAPFLEGLALLHDFEYRAAAEAFRRAQSADPGFAMAYWGEAMTANHPLWAQQDVEVARVVLNRLAPTPAARRAAAGSERERMYLDAVEALYGEGDKAERDRRYSAAMAALHERFPDDVDATAFYGLSILGTASAGRDTAVYMRAAAVLEEAWMTHREHPGLVHYLIHCYDDPAHAPLGLRAARLYARIAPGAAHAQHMTSHIFLALGMWPETVAANVEAIAAADRLGAPVGRPPVRCGHYPTWLEYGRLQLGDAAAARAVLEGCRASLAGAEPVIDHDGGPLDPDDSPAGSFANMRLRYLVETGEWRGEVASWTLPDGAGIGARLDFAFARALGGIALGDGEAVRAALGDLDSLGAAIAEVETRRADPDPTYRVRPQVMALEVRGLWAEHEGDLAGAEKLLREAVALEQGLPIAFGPPTIDKPTRELLGEFLLRRGRRDEARLELEQAVARTPGRRLAVRGLESAREHSSPAAQPARTGN